MISWQFASVKSRTPHWYVIALIIVLFLVVYGIFEGMYLMSIVAFLFAGVYILMENNATPTTTVEITDRYISMGNVRYEMNTIEKFTLLKNEDVYVMLRLFVKKSLTPTVDIPLTEEVDAYALKDFLEILLPFDAEADWKQSDRLIHAMRL